MATELVTYRIEGLSDVLMNSPAKMKPVEAGVKTKRIPAPAEEAEAGAYRLNGPKSQLFLPANHFRAAVLGACTNMKIESEGGKRAAKGLVQAGAFLTEVECPLVSAKTGRPIKKYETFITRCVIKSSGAGVMRARARIENWATHITFEVDTDFMNSAALLDLLNRAGKVCGVGDWRPAKSGVFGRFAATQAN